MADASGMGREIVSPLHTASIEGHDLRFFNCPKSHPDFPWCSLDDLCAVMGIPADPAREIRHKTRRDHPDWTATIATDGGITTAVCRDLAVALIEAAESPDLLEQFYQAGTKACVEQTKGWTTEQHFNHLSNLIGADIRPVFVPGPNSRPPDGAA